MLMKLKFIGDTSKIARGISILQQELNFEQSDDGFPIHLNQRKGPLVVTSTGGRGEILYQENIHFCRALGLWIENYQKNSTFNLIEEPQFTVTGAMLDASRNAVLTVDGIHNMLCKMAIMGLNVLMVYTEDTYEVEDYPYFGYMRGRYTEDEMKNCDEYAKALGIEMIPCIQTL